MKQGYSYVHSISEWRRVSSSEFEEWHSRKVNINQEIDSNLKQDCHDAGLDPASDETQHLMPKIITSTPDA
jgi:hypothetical protein